MKIIAIYGVGDSHKTTTIKEFFKKYVNEAYGFSDIINFSEHDSTKDIICSAIYNKRIKVGIASQGDAKSFLEEEFKILSDCSIIICASRTKGNGCEFLEKKAKESGHDVLWIGKGRIGFSKNKHEKTIPEKLRNRAVQSMVDLIYEAFQEVIKI